MQVELRATVDEDLPTLFAFQADPEASAMPRSRRVLERCGFVLEREHQDEDVLELVMILSA